MRKLVIPALLIVFILGGCIQNMSGPNQYISGYNITQRAIYDPALIEECKLGQCICFSCENRSSFFGFRKSLVGGNCTFITNCTSDEFQKLANLSDNDYVNMGPWPFMVGQGYSFSDFGDANPWCGNRLDMAVHWLVGNANTTYPSADADRAMCMLGNEIIPVYVLYSGSQNVDYEQAYQIADSLARGGPSGGTVGPFIITTEIDFNSSEEVINNVTKQIDKINSACNNQRQGSDPKFWKLNCMVALAPRMGDYESVKEILETRGYKDKVDLIAFGINSHYVNLSATNKKICDADDVYAQAVAFARFTLYNYSKPSIIPYIMFDAAGTDASGDCTWLESEVEDGYSTFFFPNLPALKKVGVIGAAAYDFNSSAFAPANPLGCTDCALGASEGRMRAWFASCRSYKQMSGLNVGNAFIRFPNSSGSYCDSGVSGSDWASLMSGQFGDQFNRKVPELTPPNETFFRCDACVNENATFPFEVSKQTVVTAATNYTYCESVPAIEYYSSRRNLDPMLVRALIIQETGGTFDNCSAALVSPGGKLDPSCYPKGYDYVVDPGEGATCSATKVAGSRYCAIGLMQTLIPPYTYWPAVYYPGEPGSGTTGGSGPYYHVEGDYLYQEANELAYPPRSGAGDIPLVISECSPYFNPFNATHSVCFGTYHLKRDLDMAKKNVSTYKNQLHITTSNQERVLAYYLALNYYRGYGNYIDDWILNFDTYYKYDDAYCIVQSTDPICLLKETGVDPTSGKSVRACYGQKDFIKYVRECWFGVKQEPSSLGDYASAILGMYQDLTNSCASSTCPSWKKLAQACSNNPSSWPPPEGEKCVKITTSTP